LEYSLRLGLAPEWLLWIFRSTVINDFLVPACCVYE
jgi:hypothetical protein